MGPLTLARQVYLLLNMPAWLDTQPDWQISRIRFSEKTHIFAHGRLAVRCGNRTKANSE